MAAAHDGERIIVRRAAPSIALISLLAMSKREPEPLLPVQPQQSAVVVSSKQ